MSELSARFFLPGLQAGQAQKEVTHNEALAILDLAVGASIVSAGANTPPASPTPGQCWIVGMAPEGAWAGQAGSLAGWTKGGWRFVAPPEGLGVWDQSREVLMRRVGGAWLSGTAVVIDGQQVVGSRQPAISVPTGGDLIDEEARRTISAILTTLQDHGLTEP